jgi:hypothetical protein
MKARSKGSVGREKGWFRVIGPESETQDNRICAGSKTQENLGYHTDQTLEAGPETETQDIGTSEKQLFRTNRK